MADVGGAISTFNNNAAGILTKSAGTLDGTLEISLLDGFEPNLTEMYTIMNFASRVGTFSTVNGLTIGNLKQFDITYSATSATLEVVPDT